MLEPKVSNDSKSKGIIPIICFKDALRAASADLGRSFQAGEYRLCWCPGLATCSVEQFNVDLGVLQIFGPTLQQDRTCISSQTCEIIGIEGLGLGDGDSVLLLETCSVETLPSRHPALPSSSLSGSKFNWAANLTDIVVSSPGGSYRLCWCMRGYPCERADHFAVDMGALHMIGPAPLLQHRTCYSGQSCQLDGLTQAGIADLAKILVLDTCGTSALIMPPAGYAAPSLISASSGTADVSDQVFFAEGGLYRLCWCGELIHNLNENDTHALENTSRYCELANHFAVDMGSLTVIGPAPLQDRTCVAGQSCLLEALLGTGMEAGALLILETCGVSTSADFGQPSGRLGQPPGPTLAALSASGAAFRWEAEVPAAPPGASFRLCWCAETPLMQNRMNRSSSGNLSDRCAISHNFNVDIGALHVIGPLAGAAEQQFTCVAGQRCVLTPFRGLDLMHDDRVFALDTCGIQVVPSGFAEPFVLTGRRKSILAWEGEALAVPGGQYRLCWCGNSNMSKANYSSYLPIDCGTDAGGLSIMAPAPLNQQRTCVSGQSCSLDGITGFFLSSNDAVMALDTCGADTAVINMLVQAATTSQSGSAARWDSAVVTAMGGTYRLCWCAGAAGGANPVNMSTCETPSDFTLDFGELSLLGPKHLQQSRTCISGVSCVTAALEGFHLSIHDRFLMLDTCGVSLAVVGGAGLDGSLRVDTCILL